MKKHTIKATVGTREEMAAEFIKTWRQVEAGKTSDVPNEKIYFDDERALFKALSPKRCALLRYVHEIGEVSILSLAKQLDRNYRNVYQDVKDLSQLGLIVKNSVTGKYSVPWSAVVTEISMISPVIHGNIAAHKTKHPSTKHTD